MGAYSYKQRVKVVEHRYKIVRFKLGGQLYKAYPLECGEPEYMDKIPGTKESVEFIAYLTYNRCQLPYAYTPIQ